MAKILFVDDDRKRLINAGIIGRLIQQGHEIVYRQVLTNEQAAEAIAMAPSAAAVVIANVEKLGESAGVAGQEPDAVQFVQDVAAQGTPVIVSDNLSAAFKQRTRSANVTLIDTFVCPSPLQVTTAAVSDALTPKAPGRQGGR